MNSIGDHSLNNRIHGECQALSEQDPEHRSKEWWKMFHKEMARQLDGYPAKTYKVIRNGKVARIPVPLSLADVTDSEAMKVQTEIQVTADEKGWWLWEYRKNNGADRLIYRSLGGRTYDQMQDYIREIREVMVPQAEKKDPAEAQQLRERADELAVTKQSRNTAGTGGLPETEKKPEAEQPEIF